MSLLLLLLPALFLPDVTGFRVDNAESDAQLSGIVRRHDQHLSPDIKWIINRRNNLFTFAIGILFLYLAVRNGRIKHVKSDDGIRDDEEETPDARAKFRPGPQILREINKKKEIGEQLHISRRPLCIDLHSL